MQILWGAGGVREREAVTLDLGAEYELTGARVWGLADLAGIRVLVSRNDTSYVTVACVAGDGGPLRFSIPRVRARYIRLERADGMASALDGGLAELELAG